MWNVFKKVWVKTHGNNAASVDACNIGYADGGDVTNGERILFPQRLPRRSSLRMRGSRQHEFRFWGTLTHHENKESSPWMPDQAGHDGQRCVTDSDTLSPSVSARRPLLSETGRSMIEMLGVLAIIGVLSIAAVAGYRFALLKFRANEVTNELNMRAINVSAQMLNTGTVYEKNELIEDGFGDTLTVGFPVETAISDRNTDYFEILVSDIPADLCRQILRDYENPIMIFVNNVRYNADTTICDDETQNALNDMGFIYKNDLGTHEACSEKGYFDEEDFQCHCSGNTYLDIYTNDCLCPAKMVWDYTQLTCVDSNCQEGEFEYQTTCISCKDEGLYAVTQEQCNLCPNRIWDSSFRLCARRDKCIKGESFPVITSRGFSKCAACSDSADQWTGGAPWGKEWCNACGNRHVTGYGGCVITDKCVKGTQLRYMTSSGSNSGCANSCASTDKLNIGTGPHEQELCEACVNAEGVKNRKVVGNYCVKVICDSNEFMGADGICYKCSSNTAIAVSETGSGCETDICGREIVDGKCQIKDCTNGVRLDNGACYACDYANGFKVTTDALREQCAACPNRHVNSSGYCVLEKCKLGYTFLESSGTYCQGCGDTRSLSIGTGEYEVALCNGCSTYERIALVSGQCAMKKCVSGTQGMTYTGACFLCESADAPSIGSDDYTAQLCLACSPQRFTASEKCYLCNTAATPTLETQADIKSCNACAEREVKDGKCVLVQ